MIKKGDKLTVKIGSDGHSRVNSKNRKTLQYGTLDESRGRTEATERKEVRTVAVVYLDGRVKDSAGDVWEVRKGADGNLHAVR